MHIDSFGPRTEPGGRCLRRLASCHGPGNACRGHLASRQVLVVLLHIQWAESYLAKPFELDGWEILTRNIANYHQGEGKLPLPRLTFAEAHGYASRTRHR
jgi:hypothetical protein